MYYDECTRMFVFDNDSDDFPSYVLIFCHAFMYQIVNFLIAVLLISYPITILNITRWVIDFQRLSTNE